MQISLTIAAFPILITFADFLKIIPASLHLHIGKADRKAIERCVDVPFAISPGNDGGDTTFWNYTVPGGKGGPLNSQPQPVTACGFTAEVGSEGDDGRGGDSHLAHGGRSGTAGPGNYRNAQSGALGSGGGALTKYGTYIAKTGAGGDGVVIVYGIPV